MQKDPSPIIFFSAMLFSYSASDKDLSHMTKLLVRTCCRSDVDWRYALLNDRL